MTGDGEGEHAGLPEGFLGPDGFPLSLARFRAEVVARGGAITGVDLRWVVSHPDPGILDIVISVDEHGDAIIDAGGEVSLDLHCQERWWQSPSADRDWSHIEDALLGYLNGGYTEVYSFNAEGERIRVDFLLEYPEESPDARESGGYADPAVSPDRREVSRTVRWKYPAWPAE
ncbi:hypothetical protein EV193_111155 [Herbihabitans rhizosphaerae]|uniref:Uncharacterized protein n=1 Tax=Herbihabitans rhizosphaerae TaxID=1872711 RepID=A0A4Q7KFN0_9PSEU|nr:hypothetical protein [Herbihabitans rhizosphaerae]RZS32770.1 hypothetical protein EV193_111155 [Herbihabitans rhizosphaerae]